MLRDFRDPGGPAAIDADICIAGGGAAGLTLARRLGGLGRKVLVVESGGLDYEARVQSLSAGTSSGQPYYDLDHVNLRMLGGTMPIWGGRCAALDPIDFERRPWIAHSGWPFGPAELEPYYRHAAQLLGIAPPDEGRQGLLRRLPLLADLDRGDLRVGAWSFDDRSDRFRSLDDLTRHPHICLLTHATALSLDMTGDRRSIGSLTVGDVEGRRGVVRARFFVLALGGLETPRLMLNSDQAAAHGVGNARGLVGRFFMEHPHARGGRVETRAVWPLLQAFGRSHRAGGSRAAALLTLSPEAQRRRQTLNAACTLGARQPAAARQAWAMRAYGHLKHDLSPSAVNRRLWRGLKTTAVRLHEWVDPLRPWLLVQAGRRELAVILRAEQAPNPESRVRLGGQRDALGQRRIDLDWRLSDLDKHSVRVLVEALDTGLRRRGLGTVVAADWLDDPAILWRSDPTISAHPIGGYHHMGTARMGLDASDSVVDADGRVHGLENLYVAGSAVFPTSGWANPTFTILALSLRLGDHLAERLARDEAASAKGLISGAA